MTIAGATYTPAVKRYKSFRDLTTTRLWGQTFLGAGANREFESIKIRADLVDDPGVANMALAVNLLTGGWTGWTSACPAALSVVGGPRITYNAGCAAGTYATKVLTGTPVLAGNYIVFRIKKAATGASPLTITLKNATGAETFTFTYPGSAFIDSLYVSFRTTTDWSNIEVRYGGLTSPNYFEFSQAEIWLKSGTISGGSTLHALVIDSDHNVRGVSSGTVALSSLSGLAADITFNFAPGVYQYANETLGLLVYGTDGVFTNWKGTDDFTWFPYGGDPVNLFGPMIQRTTIISTAGLSDTQLTAVTPQGVGYLRGTASGSPGYSYLAWALPMQLSPNVTYRVSAWVRGVSSYVGDTFFVGMCDQQTQTPNMGLGTLATLSAAWQKITFTLTPTPVQLKELTMVQVGRTDATTTASVFEVSGIMITEGTATPAYNEGYNVKRLWAWVLDDTPGYAAGTAFEHTYGQADYDDLPQDAQFSVFYTNNIAVPDPVVVVSPVDEFEVPATTDCHILAAAMRAFFIDLDSEVQTYLDLLPPRIELNRPEEPGSGDWLNAWEAMGGVGAIPADAIMLWYDRDQAEFGSEYLAILGAPYRKEHEFVKGSSIFVPYTTYADTQTDSNVGNIVMNALTAYNLKYRAKLLMKNEAWVSTATAVNCVVKWTMDSIDYPLDAANAAWWDNAIIANAGQYNYAWWALHPLVLAAGSHTLQVRTISGNAVSTLAGRLEKIFATLTTFGHSTQRLEFIYQ